MSVVLAARPGEDAAGILLRARVLDQRLWHLPEPIRVTSRMGARLHAQGVSVVSVSATAGALPDAVRCASALGARRVVVDGGMLEGREPEVAADTLVRVLHAPLADGVPLAIRNTAAGDGLLGLTACMWLLEDLPRLGLWLDPAGALARTRAVQGAALTTWTDTFAARTGGVFVHGLGTDGAGHAHPTDDGADWAALRGVLPRHVPWILDMAADDDGDLADALAYLRGL